MIVRIITAVGFFVLAGLILFIVNTSLSFGALTFVLILVIMGIALVLSVYFQPDLSDKKPHVTETAEVYRRMFNPAF